MLDAATQGATRQKRALGVVYLKSGQQPQPGFVMQSSMGTARGRSPTTKRRG